ncbi:MAG: D-aminoacyl-tRNA deacylase [Desulfovibrio sp.]
MSKKKHHALAVEPESLGMPFTGADSHAHLDMRHFGSDFDAVLERAARAGVATIGNVFLSVAAWEAGRERFTRLAKQSEQAKKTEDAQGADYTVPCPVTSPATSLITRPITSPTTRQITSPTTWPDVFFLLGTHPTDAMQYSPDERAGMTRAFASDSRLRAVGEIGLDFYWKECPKETQIPVFIDQLHFARDRNLPVVIHSRDAFEETLTVLREQGFCGYPVLWHCFGGDIGQVARIVEAGWYVSIPGPVTFPANDALRQALTAIPPDKLLVETDCPYLAPMPYRGKRNEPAYTVFTAAKIAEALGEDPAALWTRCGDNARRFFKV